ncbi:MAG: hypothetical protein ICV68_12350 [Pyrinomonadaceae bacterium]|nr:hypothetical protein [Pyrinomonadaceae bacterium]
MPTLANPLRWRCLAETDSATYLYHVSIGAKDNTINEANTLRYAKLENEDAALATRAATDERARVMLDFARFPVVRVEGDCVTQAIVQFADLRYTEPGRSGRSGGFAAVGIPVECSQGDAATETSNR